MQERAWSGPLMRAEEGLVLERVALAARRLWFGSEEVPLGGATALMEPGDALLMLVDASAAQAGELTAFAVENQAWVLLTSFSRPTDLAMRLRRAGYRLAQRSAAYLLEPGRDSRWSTVRPRRYRCAELFRRNAEVSVQEVSGEDLLAWNTVCWRAFGMRGREADSLAEKQEAFARMRGISRWYLAWASGRPAGTALLFQGTAAAEILALGTEPSLRRCGIGTAVLRRVMADWQEWGEGPLFLDTRPGSPAERLYLAAGFRLAYMRDLYAPGELVAPC